MKHSIHNEDLDDDFIRISDNYNDRQDDNAESDDEPLQRPARKAMGKPPSKDSFMSTLGKRVAATQSTPAWEQPLHPESQEVFIVSEEVDDPERALLASKMVSDYAFQWLNPPTNVYIY